MSPRAFDRFMVDVEVGRNLKLARLAPPERWAFVAGVLPIAAKAPMRGSFMIGPLAAGAADVARQADVPASVVTKMLGKVRDLALLERDEDGIEWIHDWEDWQREPTREKDAERARRYRDRKKAERDASTNSHGPSRDALRDAGVTNHGTVTPEVEGEVEQLPTSSLRSDVVAANGDEGSDGEGNAPARLDDARERLRDDAVGRVWAAYDETRRTVLGERSAAKLTPARRQLVGRRLKEWPEPDLLDAVRGWRHSEHNRGENERGQPYCDLELLLRDAAHIERFRDLERGVGNGRRPSDPETPLWLRKQREAAAASAPTDPDAAA